MLMIFMTFIHGERNMKSKKNSQFYLILYSIIQNDYWICLKLMSYQLYKCYMYAHNSHKSRALDSFFPLVAR